MKYAWCGFACLGLLACVDGLSPSPPMSIWTDRAEYVRGGVIEVSTTNLSSEVVFDDHCAGAVEGFDLFGAWNGSFGTGRACLERSDDWRTHSVAIPPGATHMDTFQVSMSAYAGTWRVRLLLRSGTGSPLPEIATASNTFRVLADQHRSR